MAAAHYKLDNLTFMLDYNKLQIDGRNDEVMSLGNIMKKFDAFGFECFEVDGHDMDAIVTALKLPYRAGRNSYAATLSRARAFPLWRTSRMARQPHEQRAV